MTFTVEEILDSIRKFPDGFPAGWHVSEKQLRTLAAEIERLRERNKKG